jgi:hypothetical protein
LDDTATGFRELARISLVRIQPVISSGATILLPKGEFNKFPRPGAMSKIILPEHPLFKALMGLAQKVSCVVSGQDL